MAPGGMNMSVGLDLSALQKDLKVLDRDLNSKVGQEKILKIKAVIEMDDPKKELDEYTGQIKKVAREGFEPLYRAIKRLQKAQEGLKFNVGGVAYDVNSIKEAQKYMRDLRKEFNAREKNGTMTADWKRQYVDAQAQMSEWVKATRSVTRELGSYGLLDYDKEAGKIKSLRAAYNKELKAIKAEMASLGDVEPRDLKRREELLTRQIALQEKLNATYKRVSPQKQQAVSDLRAERDAIRLKQKEADIQTRINSLENDRANAKNLTKKISQIQAERSAVGKLITSYEQLAARQRKYGANSAAAEQRVAMLKQEHIALKNLEAEERARMKAVNQNNALFNDQKKVFEKLWTVASRYLNIFMLWNFGEKIIRTTGYFQQQQVALEGILGSAAKAEKAILRIKNMALNSPKTTYELVGYTKQLAAYNVGDSDPDKLLDTVHQLAELSTGLGVDMQRLILAYGQVNAAAVLRGQELRQFTEAGIPMVQALADKFTQLNGRLVTTGEVFELISKRQVPFEMVASVLSDMTKEGGKFYEMQSRITDTLYGQMQKLKDLWTLALDNLGKSTDGLLGWIVSKLQSLVRNIRPIANGLLSFGILKTAAKWFGTIVLLSGNLNVKLLRNVVLLRQFHRQLVAAKGAMATMNVLARGLMGGGLVGALFNVAIAGISLLTAGIVKARQKSKEWKQTLNEINVSFAKDTYALTSGLDKLIGKLSQASRTSKDYKDILDTLKSNYGEYLNDNIISQLELEAKNAEATALSWGKLSDAIKEAIIAKKEYERHDTRRSTAIDNIMKDLEGEFNSIVKSVIRANSTTRLEAVQKNGSKNLEFVTTYNDIAKELQKKDANGAIMSAVREFLDRGLENASDLQPILETQMLRYGFTKKAAGEVGGQYEDIFKEIRSAQGYKQYTEETEYLNTALQNMLNNAFRKATDEISNNYANYTGTRDNGGTYNPFGIQEFQNNAYIGALRKILEGKEDGYKEFSRYIPKEFTDALKKDDAFLKAIKMSDADEGKTKAIADAITTFVKEADNINPTVAQNIHSIVSEFIRLAGTNGVDAARIRTHMGQYVRFDKMNLTDDEKDYINRFKPTDQTLEKNISTIASEYQDMYDFNKKLLSTDPNATFNEKYRENKRLMSLLDVLAEPEYYNQGSWLKKSGSGSDHEFPDFYNILKNAYELYKKALQQGGVKNGINEVRTNAKIQEVYGGLFGGEGGTDFDSKIGNKTLGEILVGSGREHLIKGGLEDGIVNFREAGQALAEELEAYGKEHKETHGSYIRLAEQIRKWVDETFTKDEIQKWLESFERSVQNLTIDFENMHNNIDLGRAMIANGTIGSFADITGIARPDLTRPQSQEQRENIGQLIAKYNEWAKETVGENGEKAPVFELGDMKNIKDVRDQIAYLNEQMEMNKGAFKALPQGEILTKALITALKDLDKTMRTEIAGINGRHFSGNPLADSISNAMIDRDKILTDVLTKMNTDMLHSGEFQQSIFKAFSDEIKKYVEEIHKKFESIEGAKPIKLGKNGNMLGLRPYDIEAMRTKYNDATKNVKSASMKGELDEMWYDLEKKMKQFNASIGSGILKDLQNFTNPEVEAKRRYDKLKDELDSLTGRNRDLYDMGYESLSEKQQKEFADNEARIKVIVETQTKMGKDGVNIIPDIQQEAADNMNTNVASWGEGLNKAKAAADALMGSIKSMVSTFSKFYDMMNDGENPEALKDIEGFVEDMSDDFSALMEPIVAVMGLVIALTAAITFLGVTAGAVFGALIAAALIVAAIMAVFQMHDRRLERQIEKLKDEVEELDAAMQHLQSIANRTVGFEKLRNEIAATGKELEKAALYAEMANKEKDKKNTDDDKVREYERSQQEALDAFEEGVRQMRDTLVKSTDDWASQMGSAIRQAFQNGENAARAFRDTVKTMMGDVIEKMLQMAIIEPLMESILQEWTNSDYLKQKYTKTWTDENGIKRQSFDQDNYLKELIELIKDPDRANKAYDAMVAVGDMVIDTINELPTFWKDAYMHDSELGTLSGGIESVTEDTARRIEALENSQLGEVFAIRTILEQYLGNSGGFGDSTMASVQAAVVSIASDTSVISRIMQSFENQLNELRTGPSRPLHVTMV